MEKTENYQLNQWEAGDAVRRADFNADNAKIDAAIAENAKALTDYKTANDAALAAGLGTGGHNCRIAYGSYTGTGKAGSSSPNTLTFDFTPKAVLVVPKSSSYSPIIMAYGEARSGYCTIVWSGNSVSWYDNRDEYNQSVDVQMNALNAVYFYIALGY